MCLNRYLESVAQLISTGVTMRPTSPSIEFLPDTDFLVCYNFIISQQILKGSALQETNEEIQKPRGSKFNVADRPVRRICLRAAPPSTMTNESIYFNYHESYYNKITIKRCFDGLDMYERYAQATSISYTSVELAAVPRSMPLQLPPYDYFRQFLSNFRLRCQLKRLLLQYISAFILASVFGVDFR